MSGIFIKTGVATSGFAAAFSKVLAVGLKFMGIAGIVGCICSHGKAVKKYRDDIKDAEEVSSAVDGIISKIKVDLTKGFDAEPITKRTSGQIS